MRGKLKTDDSDKLILLEYLTKYRFNLVKMLRKLKTAKKIESYWDFNGKIYCKI
ncbi:hypothetical protein CHS0354_017137, partial [Potamilus streckersoni]